MRHLNQMDLATRMSKPRGFRPKKDFKPGGEKGKLHREMGIPEGEKIPKDKLRAATHSSDPEKRRDAIRAETMSHWKHGGSKKRHPGQRRGRGQVLYDKD